VKVSWDVMDLLGEIEGIGGDPVRGGYSRHVFEPAEMELREWFTRRARALGLAVEPDRNGNIWAYWGVRGPGTVAVGSHLDSVPGGGALDGPLGVASALSAVAWLTSHGVTTPSRPVAVVAFAEEEGSRFGIACLGSKLTAGAINPESALRLADAAGTTFADAAASAGVDPPGIGRDDERLAELAAFVELHVEQGRALADLGAAVAVASGILAHGRWRLRFTGEGNHAGATPMAGRRDPLAAAAAAILAARAIATSHDDPRNGRNARATVGRLGVVPGGNYVIASRADAWLDLRADDDASTRSLLAEVLAAAEEAAADCGCALEVTEESYVDAVIFDPALADRLGAALGGPPVLATGAGHDAGVLAGELPTAMLFVRNPTGVSHSPFETASDDDCRAGVEALTAVLRELVG
jgi:N-carbamoyl-L-amino-acid hydrolase